MSFPKSWVERADEALGDAVESLVSSHHRRRLGKLGHAGALDPEGDGLWATGAPAPREGNSLDVLVDGEAAFAAMERELQTATSHVHIAGWHVTPSFRLRRDEGAPALRDLLADRARDVDVRVLLWAGAPLPLFHPSRAEVRRCRDELVRDSAVRCALDSKERPMHCHHEKLVVIDDRVAFVGGIDLTSLAGDRYDTRGHPARGRLGWHDVAARLEGPVVADVASHFGERWRGVTGEPLATPAPGEPAGDVDVQLVRTVPERLYDGVRDGDFRIVESYLRALHSAQRLVHLENQFLWSPEVTRVLAAKLSAPPTDEFRIVLVLPAKPNNGQEDTRGQLSALVQADQEGGGGRMLACTVRSRSGGEVEPLYVHAKVGIVDDRWLTLGSANLNAHSFFNDSEVNLVTCDPRVALATRRALWAEHLELDPAEVAQREPADLFDEVWLPVAKEERRRASAGEAATHRLVELPGLSRRTARLRGPLDALVVDG